MVIHQRLNLFVQLDHYTPMSPDGVWRTAATEKPCVSRNVLPKPLWVPLHPSVVIAIVQDRDQPFAFDRRPLTLFLASHLFRRNIQALIEYHIQFALQVAGRIWAGGGLEAGAGVGRVTLGG